MRLRRPLDDATLVRRTAAGDEAAFAELYRRHLDGVLAFLRRRVPSPEVAYDLTAETFAAVIVSAEQFTGEGAAVGWIYGIARNKLRESLRRGRVEDDARGRLALEPVALSDAAIERVEERALGGEPAMVAALATLSPAVRDAVVARVIDEAEYDEIAAALGCSEQVVRQRVSRGLRTLRTALEEDR